MSELMIVAISGLIGTVSRYSVYLWMGRQQLPTFPWATLFVNVLGCLLIGIIGGLVERSVPYHRQLYLAGSVGFLGAFTTFSAFGFETISLIRNEGLTLAALNVTANVLGGLTAVWIGRHFGSSVGFG